MFPDAFGFEVAIKIIIYTAIWTPLHVLWLFAGVRLRQLNLGASTQRAINIAMACAMVLVVGLALYSSL
jgi:threonine/homoserine/homoserine lactone efflux protein